jgi:cell division protein FtsQ
VSNSASTAAGRRRAASRRTRASATKGASAGRASGGSSAGTRAPTKRSSAAKRAPKRAPKRPAKRTAKRTAATRPTARRRPGSKRTRRSPLARLRDRRPTGGSLRARALIVVIAAAALAGGYFGWLRDSSLVAVTEVRVKGIEGAQREEIVAALTGAGESMTTLHLDEARLEEAVSGFPIVAGITADTNFPHGLTVQVQERPPAVLAKGTDRTVAVAADGTVLPGVDFSEKGSDGLPTISADRVPASGRLDGEPLAQALVAGAAPEPLRELIEEISYRRDGVEVVMEGGIPIRFGEGTRAAAKWAAAAAVMADPKLDALTYLDVRVPSRPAVGGAAPLETESEPEP